MRYLIRTTALALLVAASPAAPGAAAVRDDAGAARAAYDEGQKRASKDDYRDAIARFQKAHDLWKAAGDRAGEARALVRIGQMYRAFANENDKALDAFTRALEPARASGDEELVASLLGDLARARAAAGDLAGGVEAYEEALAIYGGREDHAAEAATFSNIGLLYGEAGDAARADEYRKKALETRARYHLPPPIQRVSGGVLAGRALTKIQPSYPDEAKADGIQGAVVVEVTVGTDGKVESARVVSGHPALTDAAVAAARQWVFTPIRLGGEPVRVIGTITFNFRRS